MQCFALCWGIHSLLWSPEPDVFRYPVISLFKTSPLRWTQSKTNKQILRCDLGTGPDWTYLLLWLLFHTTSFSACKAHGWHLCPFSRLYQSPHPPGNRLSLCLYRLWLSPLPPLKCFHGCCSQLWLPWQTPDWWFKKWTFISLSSGHWKSEMKVPVISMSVEMSLPGLQTADFSLGPLSCLFL